ncbi:MAG TPA: tetratricopeptide repeat protein [Patescibacteria group bacterium]|nr:tetratricopeptide repeat protein [Patescibacteria group bacterium]
MARSEIIKYIDAISNIVISLTLFLLPVFFLTSTTDFFIIPKQILVTLSVALLLVLWGIKTVAERKIVVTVSPLNLPLVIFGLVILVSSFVSPNRYDSLMQSVPLIALVLFALLIINTVRSKKEFSTAISSYMLGAAVSAIVTFAYFLKLYIIPISAIQGQYFNTAGSALQQFIYILPALVICVVYLSKKFNFPKMTMPTGASSDYSLYIHLISLVALTIAGLMLLYEMFFLSNKPVLLPYIYGFQTAFAAVSQDAGRFFLALLFGSGYGTFLTDFTRYKLLSFNLEPNIWNLSFSFSSSYLLELVATTGILGLLSYIGLIFSFIRVKAGRNPFFVAIFIAFVLSIILPFSYISVAGLFALLGLYVADLNAENNKKVYEVILSLVMTKSGMLSFETMPEQEHTPKSAESPIFSALILIIVIVISGFVSYYTFMFVSSDIAFADSLRAAQANNGQATYQLQTKAINDFPYRSDYHRIFSQVNLALANSIAASVKPGTQPSKDVQQNIVSLLQQSINSGRNAVVLSPRTSLNWQNLGVVYRSLINVGQNADQFSVASVNQAIALDPYNPDLYIMLGGIYYQLQQWDQAANQFQVAINLKRDYPNAYYNLGHAFESKGDLQNALAAYQVVHQLSANNKDNLARIDAEIKTLQDKIGAKNSATTNGVPPSTEQTPLSISQPSTALPEQKPPIKISPPPTTTPTPSEGAGKPTPSVSPEVSPAQQ